MADDPYARIAELEAELAASHSREADLTGEVERLRPALSEAVEQQAATADVLRVIASSPTALDTVLQAIVDVAARICNADSLLMLPRERDGTLAARVGTGRIREIQDALRQEGKDPFEASHGASISRQSIAGRAFLDRRTYVVGDLANQDEFP
jgi:hypothetical protein